MQAIILSVGSALVSAALTFYITRKVILSRLNIYTNEAKAKAKAIEHEAELILHRSKLASQEIEFEAKRKFEDELMVVRSQYEAQRCELEKEEHRVQRALEKREALVLEKEKKSAQFIQKINQEIAYNQKMAQENEQQRERLIKLLEQQASMTQEEATHYLIEELKVARRAQISQEMKRLERENSQELKKRAAYILAQATTRFAGEFAQERLVNRVELPDDELKGRIIGKEGRNIKVLEALLGVDIIIDETPHMIEISSHNLYRRAIATRTIELLIEDGRIQPARIEEIYNRVSEEFEAHILEEGEHVIAELGLASMHPDIVKMVGKLRYRASYGQNALAHTLEVAHFAGIIASELGGDETLAKRAGLLHDIGKSMTHELGGNHVDIGADICKRHHEDPVVINAIYAHHDQEEIGSIECAAVCAADALSAARPGARREAIESYVKRVKEIEEIALSKNGVKQAYAINAGREVRVIVNAELINEAESALVATEIATEIERRLQYPGEVKVNVIREERFVALAK